MNWKQLQSVVGIAALSIGTTAGAALAEGELFMYNWTDYTSPELIKKFEKEHDVKVTLDTFDSNETLLAKLKSGGTGYDIIVPGQNFIPVFIKEGLLQKIGASKLAGYQNIADDLVSPAWDAKNAYTIPWQWGTTTFAVNTAVYSGDIDTYKTLFEPPEELKGKIGMFKNAVDTVAFAQIYLGLPLCNESPDDMKKVLALLESQKPHVKVYNSDGVLERLVSGDTDLHQIWNGYTVRARKQKATIKYSFPKEGVLTWVDSIAVPKGAKNYDNAIKFIEFLLKPENIAVQSNFAGYSNGIKGSAEFMKDELKIAPELSPPAGTRMVFAKACGEKAIKLRDRVWTKLLK